MKILVTLAVLCILQAFAEHHNIGDKGNKPDSQGHAQVAAHKDQENHSNQQSNKKQQVQQLGQQHVAEQLKPTLKPQQSTEPSKVSVEIPAKVQHVVTQVSQHVPQLVEQHVANKQRMVRSVKNRSAWQSMQVDAKEQPGKCEYMCNLLDTTVCGYNGRCYWEFQGQCDLSAYNCLNTDKKFHIVDFAKCRDVAAAECYRGDL